MQAAVVGAEKTVKKDHKEIIPLTQELNLKVQVYTIFRPRLLVLGFC